MTNEEAIALTRYVKALCPQQKFDEYTPDAWYDVLHDYTLAEARTAAVVIAGRQPFVAPGEIATEARKARRDRVTLDAETEPPNANPDDVPLYLRTLRAHRRGVATGHIPPVPAPRALTTGLDVDDVRAMRQQKDLEAFIKQTTKDAKERCAARVQLVGRYADLTDRVATILDRPNWNGFVQPEHDCTGKINDSPVRRRLVEVLEEAEQRAAGTT